MLPNRPIASLEDTITHALSEWLNDAAPLGEERYRAPAKSVIAKIEKFIADQLDAEADERERAAMKKGAAFSDIANWQRKIASRIRSGELCKGKE